MGIQLIHHKDPPILGRESHCLVEMSHKIHFCARVTDSWSDHGAGDHIEIRE